MAGNAFIRFFKEGNKAAEGESFQTGYEGKDGWVEIGDWSWDIEAESNFLKGGGAAVGKPVPSALSFSHAFDKSSKGIMLNIIKGTHFDKVELVMLKSTGQDTPKPYFKLTATSAFTTKVSSKGGEDGAVSQDVEMVFKTVEIEYFAQDNKNGKLTTTNPWKWDISAMKATGG